MQWNTTRKLQTEYIKGEEVTRERYYEMLEVLPPQAMVQNAFLVGEPTDHGDHGRARYALYFTQDGKYFYGGLASENDFKIWLLPYEADEINDEDLEAAAEFHDRMSAKAV